MEGLLERFLKYVKINSQSDPDSQNTPSSENQWEIARLLKTELETMGMEDVKIDEKAYVTARLSSNVAQDVPVIGFIAHFDTSPDFTAEGVNPQIVENYDGGTLVLNEALGISLSPDYFEELSQYKGQTLITTDGTTLLGADDKAGIAEIMTAMEYLIAHPELPHGELRVGFTPDEEIGRGAHHFDVDAFGADWAYTLDGSTLGELEYENFNAAKADIHVQGKSVHPGYAKDKMVNAINILREVLAALPAAEVPEHTSDREGFFHLHRFEGSVEKATASLIIRDHDFTKFQDRKELLRSICQRFKEQAKIDCFIEDQYFNMREKIEPVFHIVEIARRAMEENGIKPIIKPIRGGTDGSQLSFMGLPCPNIFAGGHNFHGKYEYVPLQSMEKAVQVILSICQLTATQSNTTWKKQKK